MSKHRSIILICCLSSTLGIFIGVVIALWFHLSGHSIDLLTFTESTFGIGLSILAAIEALRIFSLQDKVIVLENRMKESIKRAKDRLEYVENITGVSDAGLASGNPPLPLWEEEIHE